MSEENMKKIEQEIEKVVQRTDNSGFADRWLGKLTSRKLLVWTVASAALFMSQIKSEDWVAISLAYIGSQALVDLAARWREAGSR